jgi:hypothetical protein
MKRFSILVALLLLAVFAIGAKPRKTPEELAGAVFDDFHKYGTMREPNTTEDLDARDARYRFTAEKLVESCQKHPWPGWPLDACVTLSATAAKWESGFLLSVQTGKLKGKAGELCFFQLHPSVISIPDPAWSITREEWKSTVGDGDDAVAHCVEAGVKALGWQVKRCRIKFEGGGWYAGSHVFAEFHIPSTSCDAIISGMSGTRGRSYSSLLQKIRNAP